jgi:hypothetical protein
MGHISSAPAPGGQGQESYAFYNVKRYRPYFNVDTAVSNTQLRTSHMQHRLPHTSTCAVHMALILPGPFPRLLT